MSTARPENKYEWWHFVLLLLIIVFGLLGILEQIGDERGQSSAAWIGWTL